MPKTRERVEKVKAFREKSRADATRNLAGTPTLYHLNVVPDTPFLLIPSTSSGKRRYVPMGFMKPPVIPSNAAMIIPDASLGLFGLLTSRMHMVWLAIVGGRLRMDLRYSAGMVYNTFPIPDAGLEILEPYAQKVLDARANHPNSTLADLYDPLTMPVDLIRAHRRLDKTVDHMYHRDRKPFDSDDDRLEFLLEQYGKMVARKQQ